MEENSKQALIAMLIATILFTGMGMFVKVLSPTLPATEIAFFRNIFGLCWMLGSLLLQAPKNQIGGKPLMLFVRGISGGTAMMAYFYNMSVMSLGTAYAFSYTAPIFLALFTVLFTKKRVSLPVWFAIIIGFSGILLIGNPQSAGLSLAGFLIGIYSGIGGALAYFSISEIGKCYDSRIIMGSLMFYGALLPLCTQLVPYEAYPIALFEPFVMPNFKEWILLIGLGLISTYAQVFLTKSYIIGNPSVVGAVSYVTIFFATLAGMILGDATPTTAIILGMVLIACGGILAAFYKKGQT